MSNLVRILLVIAFIAALYYLVVVLARSVREEEFGRLEPGVGVGVEFLTREDPVPDSPSAGRLPDSTLGRTPPPDEEK